MNITRDDILGMCDLTEEEVDAIAEHEHVPEAVAAALGNMLVHRDEGIDAIRRMIKDDVRAALARGDRAHASSLVKALHHFVAEHHGRPM